MRMRKIKKMGNSWCIHLSSYDVEDFGIVEGDEVDIEDLGLLITKKKKFKKRRGR